MLSKKGLVIVFLLAASIGAVLTYNYFTFFELEYIDQRLELHHEILDGKAPSPYNYRLLVPLLTESFAQIVSSVESISYQNAWLTAYLLYDFVFITLFLFTLFLFLQQWHNPSISLVGMLFCAALLPISLRDHYFQPWSLIEAWIFVTALLAAFKGRFYLLLGLTVLASLNRVTGLFIPFVYLFGTLDIKAVLKRQFDRDMFNTLFKFIGLVLISIGIAVALRYVQGVKGHIHTVGWLWDGNTSFSGLILSSIHLILFAGIVWVFAVMGIGKADTFTRQEALLIPVYLIPIILFGIWKEVRLLLPLYPIIISLALFYIRDELDSPSSAATVDGSVKIDITAD